MFRNLLNKGKQKLPDPDETDPTLLKRKIDIRKKHRVDDDYDVFEVIGSGRFGQVKRCVEKATLKEFAAKFIEAHTDDEREAVLSEVTIMKKLRHPRLLQLCDVYNFQEQYVLILEIIKGGELFERVIDESFDLTEGKCVKFMREICEGVDYIHRQNVVHLDLKPENILCLTRTGCRIKIIDFGLARPCAPDLRVLFGTPEFVAPEVLSYDAVGKPADMWALGVICYVLLSGLSPFMGDNNHETFVNIIKAHYTFDYQEFENISDDAKDFVSKLLLKDPKKRMTSKDYLKHRWLKESTISTKENLVCKARLKRYFYKRKWQRAYFAIIALIRMGAIFS